MTEQEKNVKKVLFLSLGVGDLFYRLKNHFKTEEKDFDSNDIDNNIKLLIEKGLFSYRQARYILPEALRTDELNYVDSEYVAEPICKVFKPDFIYIIGTIKSDWASFFNKFYDKDRSEEGIESYNNLREKLTELYKIQSGHGIATGKDVLLKQEEKINKIFESIKIEGVSPKIVLIQYGVDEIQLRENYELLSGVWEELSKSETKEYHVAYDITHSFRSLPLYNFMILNYRKHISDIAIHIKHVFYGMVDISSESIDYLKSIREKLNITNLGNDNKIITVAPLVDLKNLMNVIELSEGVSEFKNTGCSQSLCSILIRSNLGSLEEAIRTFDYSTQLNNYSRIEEALELLNEELKKEKNESVQQSFVDLKYMIKKVLDDAFGQNKSEDEKKRGREKKVLKDVSALIDVFNASLKEKAYKQFLLAKWYRKQNRMGVTVATALESLRSYLCLAYISDYSDESFYDENNRKNAEILLINRIELVSDDKDSKLLKDIAAIYPEVKDIRNAFAHNLADQSGDLEREQESGATNANAVIVDKIDALMGLLEKFINDWDSLKEKLKYIYSPIKEVSKTESLSNVRLLITKIDNFDFKKNENLKQSKKTQYEVYQLDDEIRKRIFSSKEITKPGESRTILSYERNFSEFLIACLELTEYLYMVMNQDNKYAGLSIVFDDIGNRIDGSHFNELEKFVLANIINKRVKGLKFRSLKTLEEINTTAIKMELEKTYNISIKGIKNFELVKVNVK